MCWPIVSLSDRGLAKPVECVRHISVSACDVRFTSLVDDIDTFVAARCRCVSSADRHWISKQAYTQFSDTRHYCNAEFFTRPAWTCSVPHDWLYTFIFCCSVIYFAVYRKRCKYRMVQTVSFNRNITDSLNRIKTYQWFFVKLNYGYQGSTFILSVDISLFHGLFISRVT